MADETRERTPGALVRAKVLELRPINPDEPKREDGSFKPHVAKVEAEVLISDSKDVEFLQSEDFDGAKDIASGFMRAVPRVNDPQKCNLVFGGLRKWEPKPAQA